MILMKQLIPIIVSESSNQIIYTRKDILEEIDKSQLEKISSEEVIFMRLRKAPYGREWECGMYSEISFDDLKKRPAKANAVLLRELKDEIGCIYGNTKRFMYFVGQYCTVKTSNITKSA